MKKKNLKRLLKEKMAAEDVLTDRVVELGQDLIIANEELEKLEAVRAKYETDSSFERLAQDQAVCIRGLNHKIAQYEGDGPVFANAQLREGNAELKTKLFKLREIICQPQTKGTGWDLLSQARAVIDGN